MNNHDFEKLETRLRNDLEARPSARVLQRLEKKAAWQTSPWKSLSSLLFRLAIVGLLIALTILPLMQGNPRSESQPDSAASQVQPEKRLAEGTDSDNLLAVCGAGSHFAWRNQAEFSGSLFDENHDRSANFWL